MYFDRIVNVGAKFEESLQNCVFLYHPIFNFKKIFQKKENEPKVFCHNYLQVLNFQIGYNFEAP